MRREGIKGINEIFVRNKVKIAEKVGVDEGDKILSSRLYASLKSLPSKAAAEKTHTSLNSPKILSRIREGKEKNFPSAL